jgi:hypothetical protein
MVSEEDELHPPFPFVSLGGGRRAGKPNSIKVLAKRKIAVTADSAPLPSLRTSFVPRRHFSTLAAQPQPQSSLATLT